MLAREAVEAFDDPGFLFEIKWDGYRALAERAPDGRLHLWSRTGRDLSPRFPALAEALRQEIVHPCLLDGEIVALAEGASDIRRLQRRQEPIVYVVFDLLRWRTEDLLPLPLRERRARLADRVGGSDRLVRSEGVVGAGVSYFRAVRAAGLEGMMAKALRSPYLPGVRSDAWRKVLNLREGTFAVVAAEPGPADGVAAVWVADVDGRPVARIAGLPPAAARRVRARAAGHVLAPGGSRRPALAVAPGLSCRVRYRSVLPGGKLRHPLFAGLVAEGEDGV